MGLPYVLSSDLVSAYPAKSLEIAQYVDGQLPLLAMTQNAQTGTTYTFLLTDFTKLVTLSNASPVTVTLPLESSVAWPANTQLRLLNLGAGTVTVVGAVGVTINGSPLTLAQFKAATLVKNGTNSWTFLPFSSGVGAANFSNAATGTYSGFKYLTFSSSGTLTVTTAGFLDVLIQGGGAGGGAQVAYAACGGGGAGQLVVLESLFLDVGNYTVTIGAGGSAGLGTNVKAGIGNFSKIGTALLAGGGGPGCDGGGRGFYGANGGASDGQGSTGGLSVSNGFNGGKGAALTNAGGGGGTSAVGADGAGTTGGAGGAGISSSITGTAVTYGGGGGGGASVTGGAGGAGGGGAGGGAGQNGTAGTANTGGGGGGGNNVGSNGGAGGSGVLIVRVAV